VAPNPTPSGMFTYVPAHDELSSNVVGLDVYNKDKQNIGTIKDIAGIAPVSACSGDGERSFSAGGGKGLSRHTRPSGSDIINSHAGAAWKVYS
jgi:hypothetical protein